MSRIDNLLRLLVMLALVIVLVPLVLMLSSMHLMGGGVEMGMGMPAWTTGIGGRWLLWLSWLLPLLLLFALGVLGYQVVSDGGRDGDGDPALRELRSAYARGDLSEEEYERRRKKLLEDR